jgi:hypothetical protein
VGDGAGAESGGITPSHIAIVSGGRDTNGGRAHDLHDGDSYTSYEAMPLAASTHRQRLGGYSGRGVTSIDFGVMTDSFSSLFANTCTATSTAATAAATTAASPGLATAGYAAESHGGTTDDIALGQTATNTGSTTTPPRLDTEQTSTASSKVVSSAALKVDCRPSFAGQQNENGSSRSITSLFGSMCSSIAPSPSGANDRAVGGYGARHGVLHELDSLCSLLADDVADSDLESAFTLLP